MTLARIEEAFRRFAELEPEPKTELHYSSPFELLVAVVLSAQSTDIGVNKATAKLYPVANTPAAIAALGVEGLKPFIATLGLYNAKAKHVVALSEGLLSKHAGEVPTTHAALEALPGVGRKTANVVLNTLYGEAVMAVDTHSFRVANRTGIAPGKTVRQVEDGLMKRVPAWALRHAHHWLILHGRYICKARSPLCRACPIVDLCSYKAKNLTLPE